MTDGPRPAGTRPFAAVVGAGVAGLVAARRLAAAGRTVVVLEGGDRTGGALRSSALAGVTVDVGAEAYGVSRPQTRDLIDELGLAGDVIAPRRSDAHLLLSDAMFDMPHALLGVPTDLSADAVVAILGVEASATARDLDALPMAPAPSTVTLGALVRSRMGDAVTDRILTPVVAGVHAADPDEVEADAVLPGLRDAALQQGSLAAGARSMRAAAGVPGAAIAGLRGGMTALVVALETAVREAGAEIRLGTGVTAARPVGAGWQLETMRDGRATMVEADEVVLAIDAPAAAAILEGVPALSSLLADVRVGDVAVCALVLDEPRLDNDPVGSGLLIAPDHPTIRAKALTHASAKWDWIRTAYGPGRHLVRLSYGRNGHIEEDLDGLPDIVEQDVARIFGLDRVDPVDLQVIRWDRSLVVPAPGHRDRVRRLMSEAGRHPGLAIVGAGLGGNGLAGTIAMSDSVLDQLQPPD